MTIYYADERVEDEQQKAALQNFGWSYCDL
jgi:hypothetical protein